MGFDQKFWQSKNVNRNLIKYVEVAPKYFNCMLDYFNAETPIPSLKKMQNISDRTKNFLTPIRCFMQIFNLLSRNKTNLHLNWVTKHCILNNKHYIVIASIFKTLAIQRYCLNDVITRYHEKNVSIRITR